MDERLVGFTKRLKESETAESRFDPLLYVRALDLIANTFNEFLPLPFEDYVQRAGPGFVQLYFGCGKCPEELNSLHPELKLGEWLIEHAEEWALKLVEEAQKSKVAALYKLEVPQGVRGALWKRPVRLVWDYYISFDRLFARVDILGKIGQ